MKKLAVLLLVVFCTLFAIAQDAPKVEVFGGYQYTNVDTKGLGNRLSFNGWDADIAARVAPHFSIVGDISGAYKSDSADFAGTNVSGKVRVHNFLFGPRVSAAAGKVNPFAEALFGVGHVSVTGSASGLGSATETSNGFAMALGGGLDVSANRRVSIRLIKFDYLMNRISSSAVGVDESLNNYRIATGIVFKF